MALQGEGRFGWAACGNIFGDGHQLFGSQLILEDGKVSPSGLGIKPPCANLVDLDFTREILFYHPSHVACSTPIPQEGVVKSYPRLVHLIIRRFGELDHWIARFVANAPLASTATQSIQLRVANR